MSTSSANPGTLFGGTWQQITGRFLLAAGGGYSAGATGGEASHVLTASEMPAHSHSLTFCRFKPASWEGDSLCYTGYDEVKATGSAGGNGAHNNMPPYLVVYIWKRTA